MSYETILKRYEAAGQGHLLQFWPKLSESERESLLAQLADIDIERVNRIYQKSVGSEKQAAEAPHPKEWWTHLRRAMSQTSCVYAEHVETGAP